MPCYLPIHCVTRITEQSAEAVWLQKLSSSETFGRMSPLFCCSRAGMHGNCKSPCNASVQTREELRSLMCAPLSCVSLGSSRR